MKSLSFCFILFLFALASATDKYLSNELQQQYASLAKSTTGLKNIIPVYNSVFLAKGLEIRPGELDCNSIKFDVTTPKLAYFSHFVDEQLKCHKVVIPSSFTTSTLEDKYYSMVLNTPSAQEKKILVQEALELLHSCESASECSQSLNSIAFALKIATLSYSDLTVADQKFIRDYLAAIHPLLEAKMNDHVKWSLADVSALIESVYEVYRTELHDLLSDDAVLYIMDVLSKNFETKKTFVAAHNMNICKLLSRAHTNIMYYDIIQDVKVLMVKPVDFIGKTTRDDVNVTSPDTDFKKTHRKGIYFIYLADLPKGTHTFVFSCPKRTESFVYVNQSTVQVSSYSIYTEDETNIPTYTLPYTQPSALPTLQDGVNVHLKVSLVDDNDQPVTPVFVVAELRHTEEPQLYTQIVLTHTEDQYIGSFNILMDSFIQDLNYHNGDYTVSLRVGDVNYAPLLVQLYSLRIQYPAMDHTPHYSLYSKSLTYESDTTMVPLKEIRHQFKEDTKQPPFLVSFVFSMLIVLALGLCVMTVFSLLRQYFTKSTFSTILVNLLFVSCLSVIAMFYFKFWINWTMFDLARTLIPVIFITFVIGNRALRTEA